MLQLYRQQPRIAGTIVGGVVGFLAGLLIVGNFGVAGSGGAVGVWGWAFGLLLGGYVGFRIGERRHRRASGSAL